MNKRAIAGAILIFMLSVCPGFAADFAVIANKANPVSDMAAKDVKSIFEGKKTSWPNGASVIVVTQDGPAVHEAFTKEIVKKTPSQFALYWKKALFTGTGNPPKNFPNDAEVKAFVAANENAIGYISPGALDDTVKKLELQ